MFLACPHVLALFAVHSRDFDGTPHEEPQEYSRPMIGTYLYLSPLVPIRLVSMFLGSLFGVPSKVPSSLGSYNWTSFLYSSVYLGHGYLD